jgi:hypothetical protein
MIGRTVLMVAVVMRLRGKGLRTAGLVVTLAAACSASAHTARSEVTSVASVEPTALPTTTSGTNAASPTTRATTPPYPAPVVHLVSPALAGEGVWQPVKASRYAGGFALYTTEVRPAPASAYVGIAWICSSATRLALYAGTTQPYGVWPNEAYIRPTAGSALLAAFNSGFKIFSYQTGWYEEGKAAVPLRQGAASLVIFADGTASVGVWGRDFTMGPNVVAVRQNLTLLVDRGAVVAGADAPGSWGSVLGGSYATWRSGIGVTSGGDLVYVGGPGMTPLSLGAVLVAAGAQRAMELDINPEWVSFATFTQASGVNGPTIVGSSNLLSSMSSGPGHYLQPYSRDFFAVYARPPG